MTEPTHQDPLEPRPNDPIPSTEDDERAARKADNRTLGLAIAISTAFGVVMGVVSDNIGLWIAIAVGVGVAIGVGLNQKRSAARKPNERGY